MAVFVLFVGLLRLPSLFPLYPVATLFFFFFNDTPTTEIYPLSLHDALPICPGLHAARLLPVLFALRRDHAPADRDRRYRAFLTQQKIERRPGNSNNHLSIVFQLPTTHRQQIGRAHV